MPWLPGFKPQLWSEPSTFALALYARAKPWLVKRAILLFSTHAFCYANHPA